MPQLGETVTEGTITRWAKQIGESVAEDDVLFEVSTDKVDSEVPSPVAGVLTEILVPEGETVDVGTRLAVISSDSAAMPGSPGANGPAAASEPPAAEDTVAENAVAENAAGDNGSAEDAATDTRSDPAPQSDRAPQTVGSEGPRRGPGDSPTPPPSDTKADNSSSASPPVRSGGSEGAPSAGSGLVLSPVVRRLISEHDLDPATINGTGPGGRITRSDVLAVIDQKNGSGAPSPAAAPAPRPSSRPSPVSTGSRAEQVAPTSAEVTAFTPSVPGDHDTVVPFTNIRRRTAEHMVRSKHTSAHTMVAFEVDYSAVEKVRRARAGAFP